MRKMIFAFLMLATPAAAADLQLNDLPMVLQKLRGCAEVRGVFGGVSMECKIPNKDLWVSIASDSTLTLFRNRSYGDTTYAHGATVNELLQDFARSLNTDRANGQAMLDAMAPFLATQ